jgi:hypothetical protein
LPIFCFIVDGYFDKIGPSFVLFVKKYLTIEKITEIILERLKDLVIRYNPYRNSKLEDTEYEEVSDELKTYMDLRIVEFKSNRRNKSYCNPQFYKLSED